MSGKAGDQFAELMAVPCSEGENGTEEEGEQRDAGVDAGLKERSADEDPDTEEDALHTGEAQKHTGAVDRSEPVGPLRRGS
jgi:hypothetical protein